jgi:anhydro-N-acetylmuramic acid kinase
MHKDLHRLTQIAEAESRVIIGLMSGTSLDGLDIALCRFSGHGRSTKAQVLHFTTSSYPESLKSELKSISSKPVVDLQKVTLMHDYLGTYFAGLILEALKSWDVDPASVDLIASHGQTIFHAPLSQHQTPPYDNSTLQIGDADQIAVKTGIITLSDFRQKHIAAGGEGAPLAGYGDSLIFSSDTENRLLLNIGGIANFTYLPANGTSGSITTDVGPGNTLMDQYVQRAFPGKPYDADGELAASGRVCQPLLETLKRNPFFELKYPKTTGPEVFSLAYVDAAIEASGSAALDPCDVLATLSALSEYGIVDSIKKCIPANHDYEIYISGGGMHNKHLLHAISSTLNKKIRSTEQLDVDPDAKEAVLFALLANECVCGTETEASSLEADKSKLAGNPGQPQVSMGKISLTC